MDHNPFAAPAEQEAGANTDLMGYVMTFHDGSVWKVIEEDKLLGSAYLRLEQQNPAPGLSYTPQRITTSQAVRQRKEAELRQAGQGSLFEGPS